MRVEDIIMPVLIGVNPPERESKQRVIINIIFYEKPDAGSAVNYREIVSKVVKVCWHPFTPSILCLTEVARQEIEVTSYLTLEKFVMEIVRSSCLASNKIEAVTARAQKPSALTFAESSGVEITRRREAFAA